MKLAMVFPGQGSQSVGMLRAYAGLPGVDEVRRDAGEVLGADFVRLLDDGPAEALSLTRNTQPAMVTAGYAAYRAWSGLGAQFNYTYIEGETQSPQFVGGPEVTRPLQNVSKNNYNAVLFYENYGLSARLAYGYRSRYIDFFTQDTVSGNEDQVEPANSLDFSVSYDLTPRATMVFSATNLLGNDLHQYWGGGTTRPRDIRFQDQTIALGFRFKL